MFNEYYPENTSPDCFESYNGHHIDDRMRARGNSYARSRQYDNKVHYATPEILTQKRSELETLQAEFNARYADTYDDNGRERIVGDELVQTLTSLESLNIKIENLKHFIATAHVVETKKRTSDRVELFSYVTVQVQGSDTPFRIRIVGENEANIALKEVSCVSPVGKSLLGRQVGETVDVNVNGGVKRYSILSL